MPRNANPTAVFIHGAGGGGWEWIVWQRVFAARDWDVLAPDLRAAPDGLAATRFDDYAAQVRDWCKGCLAPPVLIGASLGGLLALAAAPAVAPSAMVLVNPLPPAGIEPRQVGREYPDVVHWGRERSLQSTRRALPDADAATILWAFRRWRDESGTVLREAHQGIAVSKPRRPVLVVASENDSDVAPTSSAALARSIDAELRVISAASHVGPLLGRGAAQVAEEVHEWLAKGKGK